MVVWARGICNKPRTGPWVSGWEAPKCLNVKERERVPGNRQDSASRGGNSRLWITGNTLDNLGAHAWRPRFAQTRKTGGPIDIFRPDVDHQQLVLSLMDDSRSVGAEAFDLHNC